LGNLDIDVAGYIGTDESGKGDYFGPLVVAAVFIESNTYDHLLSLNVRDSKKVSDGRAMELSAEITSSCPNSVVVVGAERYNELYAKIRNLNKLLAWSHARALENVLESCGAELAVTDQFGDPGYVEKALMKNGKNIKLVQETKGERYIGVAAASIVARAKFLVHLNRYGSEHGLQLPKGAGPIVDQAAAVFVDKFGMDDLRKVAKLHFKNTSKVAALLKNR
jgi:ribonuclease HIII